jgi:cyclopropane-fatty-acyl-phospholipid synthase
MRHKKNNLFNNLGKADITALVNFKLLAEFFTKNSLKIKDPITQKEFLQNMGIIERAKILSKKMKFTEQSNLYLRIQRLLSPKYMGELFKVILAYKFDNINFPGFK